MRLLKRPQTLAGWLQRLVALLAVASLAFLGYTGWQLVRTLSAVSSDPLRDLSAIVPAPSEAPERQAGIAGALARGERINILLLGYGGAGHDGAYLTDSIMLASIDGRSGVVTLVSVPRDLWVTFPKSKYSASFQGKVNAAFALGVGSGDRDEGMRIAAETLKTVLGQPIDRTVALDFRAFRAVVDQIGGIDVTVDRAFSSIYPRNDDSKIDDAWIEVSFKPGPQHMDGETALRYARARYADGVEGSDFARSARQQKVILAARDRVVATGAASQLLGLLDALRDNVRTDLSIADMRALADFAKGYDDAQTVKGALTNGNVLQSYGLPVSDGIAATLQPRVVGWSQVQAYVRLLVNYPASALEDPLVRITASARRAGAGEAAVGLLSGMGLRASFEVTGGDDPETTSVTGGSPDTVAFLGTFFGVPAEPQPGAVTVRLGRDWAPPAPFPPAPTRPASTPAPSASAPVGPAPSSSPSVRPSPGAPAQSVFPSASPSRAPAR